VVQLQADNPNMVARNKKEIFTPRLFKELKGIEMYRKKFLSI